MMANSRSRVITEPESSSDNESIFHEEKKTPTWKTKMGGFVDSWTMNIVMTIFTVYALFFDDIRLIFFPKWMDDYCYIITSLVTIAFILEIVLSVIGKEEYSLSFFFWLDVLSTLSLISDIGWITEDLLVNGVFLNA